MAVAYLTRLGRSQQLTLCLETGTRTSYIVSVLVHSSLAEPEAELACTAPGVYCALWVSVSAMALCVYRGVLERRRTDRRHADTHCELLATTSCADDAWCDHDDDHVTLTSHAHSPRINQL